jgi:predicted SAM-dependent methyltransferase
MKYMKKILKKNIKPFFGDFWWQYFVHAKNDLLSEYKIWRGVKNSHKFFRSINKPFRLQLGCGPRVKSGWINTDICQNADLTVDGILDLRRPFPFKNDSCLEIYSNHVFEHLPYPIIAQNVLNESHRILIPNGLFRVVVPDLQSFQDQSRREEWELYANWVLSLNHPSVVFGTRAEVINFLFRQGGSHHFIYDYETLHKNLLKSGFKNISVSKHDLNTDFPVKSLPSMYVNAIK